MIFGGNTSRNQYEIKEPTSGLLEGRIFQAEGTANAKALFFSRDVQEWVESGEWEENRSEKKSQRSVHIKPCMATV